MKRSGPDSLEGLFIALICCLISTLMLGSAGLSSMLFVACITRYNTDRNKAAFPFILSNVLQAVSGPFAGYFANRFSVRAVVLTGSILAFVGIGTCFFAEDIKAVTILWGIVFGTGLGLSTLLLPAVINDYFFKQRSIALGMCYLGSPIGFFIFPPIFEVLLDKYGLSGTFLFLSGINMHCIALSMLLRQPKFKVKNESSPLNHGEKRNSYLSTNNAEPGQNQQLESENDRIHYRNLHKNSDVAKLGIFSHQDYELPVDENSQPKITDSVVPCIAKFPETSKDYELTKGSDYRKLLHHPQTQNYEECSTTCFGSGQKSSPIAIRKCELDCPSKHHNSGDINKPDSIPHGYDNAAYVATDDTNHTLCKVSEVPTLIKYRKIDGFSNYPADNRNDEVKSNVTLSEIEQTANSKNNPLLSMYLNPVFILICIINGIGSLHFSTLTTVIIDFSRDHQIASSNEKFIMMCISLMGAFGMLGFGWVTDGGYMTRSRFASLSQLIGCISTSVLPLTAGFETLMIPLAIWCVCQSSFIPLIPAIIAEHFKDDVQAVAVSACNVLSGPLYLIIPPLIGYFRDEKGSYDNIFYLLGTLSFVNSIIVFAIPYLARWRAKS